MEKMKSDTPLDYAVFQLSPKRSRCELIISSDGKKEKLASGLLKPFIAHLKLAEEQFASAAQSVNLEVGKNEKAEAWFTKGTLERFVRFVSTPEILELVNTFEEEMSQLESAQRIYSQGAGDHLSGGSGSGLTAADDATKKELLRAIDVRLTAVHQDLSAACARAVAAGFDIDAVSELQIFADRFGAHRLNEACAKFISLCEKRPNLINPWKTGPEDRAIRSSYGSDMSIDDDPPSPPPTRKESAKCQPSVRRMFSISIESSVERDDRSKTNDTVSEKDGKDGNSATPQSISSSQPGRRLSVQDRISMFENKQKDTTGPKPVVTKPVELRRMSSDVSATEKAVLRRWSGASDMSVDLSAEKKDADSPLCTPSSSGVSQEKTILNLNDNTAKSSSVVKPDMKIIPSLARVSDGGLRADSFNKSEKFAESSKVTESDGLKDQGGDKAQSKSFTNRNEKHDNSEDKFNTLLGGRNEGPSMTQTRPSEGRGGRQVESSNQREDSVSTDESIKGVAGSRIRAAFAARFRGIESNSMSAQQEVGSIGKTEVVEKKDLHSSEEVLSGYEYSGPQRMKFSRQGSATELSKKVQIQRDESSFSGNYKPLFPVKLKSEVQEDFDSFSTPPPEQAQKVRQSKGNQELNDELKFKANELEKLFAEHKLRLPSDQSNSVRKGKSGSSSQFSKPVIDASPKLFDYYQSTDPTGSSKNKPMFNASSLMKTVDTQEIGPALNKSFSDLSVSEGYRGKFYDKYMQKRDAKLREEWSSNRAEKEARLKSMQDSLNRSRSEMKAKFSGSADRRTERLRSYSSRSISKSEQHRLVFGDNEDEDEAYRASDDTSFADGNISKGAQGKKHLPNGKSLLSSTTRTTAAPVPRSATKPSNINSGKRRTQPENPLAQSVPIFSDLRKENTKPSIEGSKSARLQVRNYSRSKSTNEETDMAKVSNGVALTPIKFDEEIMRSVGSKPFLKKGSRTVFDARASIARQKAESNTSILNNVEENDVLASQPDDFMNVVDGEVDEQIETLKIEDDEILEDEKPKVGPELDNFGESESENDDSNQFSRLDQALGSQPPNESTQDLPGESQSPMSWNSRGQNPFSYPHELSDVDNSVDSPVGSPASWSQVEIDAARMRKKWGTAQKPMVAAHPSNNNNNNNNNNNITRKDRNRGFKRFLKFGRKNNGSESLLDWLSATTSEGDDDTEDGRDVANRYSEDLRKSRMGFSPAQPSDDGFNESEIFNESVQSSESSIAAVPANFKLREDHMAGSSNKAPRSFFSLSTFRSKGSDKA